MHQWHFYEVHEVHSDISLQLMLQDFHVSELFRITIVLPIGVVILEST